MYRLFLLILMVLMLSSCFQKDMIEGTGSDVAKEYRFDPASDELLVCNMFQVELNDSLPEGVVYISADANLMRYVEVKNRGGRLSLQLEGWYRNKKGRVHATMAPASFRKFVALGASSIRSSERMNQYELEVRVSGASSVVFDRVEASHVHAEATGASSVVIAGRGETAKLISVGASKVDAQNLVCNLAEVKAVGASTLKVYASEEVTGHSTGVSQVECFGNPSDCEVKTTGVSTIKIVSSGMQS